ncbi:MAG TPA: hypothetical protein VIL46_06400, partial [Gemmataceae bacterium]
MSQVVRAVCPGCGKPVQVPAEWVGSTLRCKACGQVVRAVPRRTAAAAPAPPPAPGTAAPQPYTPPLTPGEPFTPPGPVFGDAAFTPAFLPEVNTNSKRPYRRPGQRGRRAVWLFGLALLALAGVATAAVLHRAGVVDLPLGRIGLGGPDDPPHEVAPAAGAQPRENPSPPFAAGAFPRRLLSINLSHYLYANPIHPGKPFGLRNAYPMDTHAVVTKLSER